MTEKDRRKNLPKPKGLLNHHGAPSPKAPPPEGEPCNRAARRAAARKKHR
ncbi:hypothetical protein RBS60_10900 [Sinomonas sp. ASV486]|nr:hypothetical protein [Sinomonas sp. ASV486]MDQ4490706.1 hypothetical protein [Sinomonas sp. ASV486]